MEATALWYGAHHAVDDVVAPVGGVFGGEGPERDRSAARYIGAGGGGDIVGFGLTDSFGAGRAQPPMSFERICGAGQSLP